MGPETRALVGGCAVYVWKVRTPPHAHNVPLMLNHRSVLCAASNGIALMLIGRTIQGIGAGGQLGLVNVTISDIVTVRCVLALTPPHMRGYMALTTSLNLSQRGLYLSYVGKNPPPLHLAI